MQRKRHLKIELSRRLNVLRLFRVGHVVGNGQSVSFHLSGTCGFHIEAENERFTAVGTRCRQNLAFENFRSSF